MLPDQGSTNKVSPILGSTRHDKACPCPVKGNLRQDFRGRLYQPGQDNVHWTFDRCQLYPVLRVRVVYPQASASTMTPYTTI
jgi:hypothetical protein